MDRSADAHSVEFVDEPPLPTFGDAVRYLWERRVRLAKVLSRLLSSMRIYKPLILVFILVLTWARSADAYVDPGTGSLIWQLIAAAFVGLMFYAVRIKRWIASKLSRKK